jgi:predicted nuclease with RNAse H fold
LKVSPVPFGSVSLGEPDYALRSGLQVAGFSSIKGEHSLAEQGLRVARTFHRLKVIDAYPTAEPSTFNL